MPGSRRHRFPRPALWIAAPVFFVCAAVITIFYIWPSLPLALTVGLVGALVVGCLGFDVRLDPANQHLHKPSVIGRMDADNAIWPVRISDGLIAPSPWSEWLAKDGVPLRRAS